MEPGGSRSCALGVLGTHFPWQLMVKHSMWMAFQHRREQRGFGAQESGDAVALDAAEPESSCDEAAHEADADGVGSEQGSEQAGPAAGEAAAVLSNTSVSVTFSSRAGSE